MRPKCDLARAVPLCYYPAPLGTTARQTGRRPQGADGDVMIHRGLATGLGILFVFALQDASPAEPLWSRLLLGHRVEADPAKDYVLTEDHGPWLIMAATFSGDGAPAQAKQLVLELRRRYKVQAYVHEQSFDLTDGTLRQRVDRHGDPIRMRYRKGEKIREIAVLVGHFDNVESADAQRVLKKIKTMRPDALSSTPVEETSQSLARFRALQVAMLPKGHEARKKGPMRKAFLTRNPLLPREFFVPKGPDKLVLKMNKGVKHSLFSCEGKYTVKVATFTGTVVLDQKKVEKYENGGEFPSRLAEAADKAHRLTLALRHKGYEAYEFHDRYASIVTVGSFNSVGLPRTDGKIEINPKIHAIMQTFGAKPVKPVAGVGPRAFQPKTLQGIAFDLQPQIVHVPKPSLSNSLRSSRA